MLVYLPPNFQNYGHYDFSIMNRGGPPCIYLIIYQNFIFVFRCFSHSRGSHVNSRRYSPIPDRIGHRTKDAVRIAGCMEHHSPLAGWNRYLQLSGHLFRGPVL